MKKKILATIVAAGTVLSGCSGGSGGSAGAGGTINESSSATAVAGYLSGTAAIGAPLGLGNVTVKGSAGACATTGLTSKTNSLGVYSIDVSSCTAPYLVKVSSSNGEVSTIATQAGVIANVTPLTQLIAKRALRSSDLTNFNQVTAQDLTAAQSEIKAVLKDFAAAVGAASSASAFDAQDLMSGAFSADGKGVDKLLDLIKVENTGDNFTLSLGALPVNMDVASNTAPTAPDPTVAQNAATATSAKVERLEAVRDFAKRLTAAFVNGAPNDSQLSVFVTSDYMHFGQSKASLLAEFAEDRDIKGLEFRNAVILKDDVNDFWVSYQIFGKVNNKYVLWNTWTTKIADLAGTPKMMGNRLPFILQPSFLKITNYNSSNAKTDSYEKALRVGAYLNSDVPNVNFTIKKIGNGQNNINIKVANSTLDYNDSNYAQRNIDPLASQYIKLLPAETEQAVAKIDYVDANSVSHSSYILLPQDGLAQVNPYINLKLPAFDVAGRSCTWNIATLEESEESEFGFENEFAGDEFGLLSIFAGVPGLSFSQTVFTNDGDQALAKFQQMLSAYKAANQSETQISLNHYNLGQYGINDIEYTHLYKCN